MRYPSQERRKEYLWSRSRWLSLGFNLVQLIVFHFVIGLFSILSRHVFYFVSCQIVLSCQVLSHYFVAFISQSTPYTLHVCRWWLSGARWRKSAPLCLWRSRSPSTSTSSDQGVTPSTRSWQTLGSLSVSASPGFPIHSPFSQYPSHFPVPFPFPHFLPMF